MRNMGLSDLAIVRPQLALDVSVIRQRAIHAWPVYEQRRECDTVADAVADCVSVAGTTARTGLYRAHAQTIREAAPGLLDMAGQGPVALVFGPRTTA